MVSEAGPWCCLLLLCIVVGLVGLGLVGYVHKARRSSSKIDRALFVWRGCELGDGPGVRIQSHAAWRQGSKLETPRGPEPKFGDAFALWAKGRA